jgi:hypothetical protein
MEGVARSQGRHIGSDGTMKFSEAALHRSRAAAADPR